MKENEGLLTHSLSLTNTTNNTHQRRHLFFLNVSFSLYLISFPGQKSHIVLHHHHQRHDELVIFFSNTKARFLFKLKKGWNHQHPDQNKSHKKINSLKDKQCPLVYPKKIQQIVVENTNNTRRTSKTWKNGKIQGHTKFYREKKKAEEKLSSAQPLLCCSFGAGAENPRNCFLFFFLFSFSLGIKDNRGVTGYRVWINPRQARTTRAVISADTIIAGFIQFV